MKRARKAYWGAIGLLVFCLVMGQMQTKVEAQSGLPPQHGGLGFGGPGGTFTGGTITSPILAPDGTASLPSYAWSANPSSGFYNVNTYSQYLSQGGVATYGFYDGSFRVLYNKSLGWATGADATGAPDLTLYRDAANTLALRNGTAAQAFRVYNTYTDASNYERVAFAAQSNNFDLYSEFAGTGVSTRKIRVYTTGQGNVELGTDGTIRWYVSGVAGSTGHLLANVDNTYDIGASGATRPRNIYAGTSFFVPAAIQGSKTKALTEGAATAVTQIAVPQTAGSNFADAVVQWTVYATDATDTQTLRGSTYLAAVNKAGTETCTVGDIGTPVVAVSAGTLTCTTSCVTGLSDAVQFALDCTSSLTQTSLNAMVRLDMDQPNTVTPQ